jgi:hypothetical protein
MNRDRPRPSGEGLDGIEDPSRSAQDELRQSDAVVVRQETVVANSIEGARIASLCISKSQDPSQVMNPRFHPVGVVRERPGES